jgi:hypothetical protein
MYLVVKHLELEPRLSRANFKSPNELEQMKFDCTNKCYICSLLSGYALLREVKGIKCFEAGIKSAIYKSTTGQRTQPGILCPVCSVDSTRHGVNYLVM